jgi:hypothetical protein
MKYVMASSHVRQLVSTSVMLSRSAWDLDAPAPPSLDGAESLAFTGSTGGKPVRTRAAM